MRPAASIQCASRAIPSSIFTFGFQPRSRFAAEMSNQWEVVKVLSQAETRSRFLAAGIEPAPSTPAELGALRKIDLARMTKLIKAAGLASK